MVEGYPEMDDYEEAELVACGEIYVEDCETLLVFQEYCMRKVLEI